MCIRDRSEIVRQQVRQSRVEIPACDVCETRAAYNERSKPVLGVLCERAVAQIRPIVAVGPAQKGDAVAFLSLRVTPVEAVDSSRGGGARQNDRALQAWVGGQVLLRKAQSAKALKTSPAKRPASGVEKGLVPRFQSGARERGDLFEGQRAGRQNCLLYTSRCV